MNLFVLFSFPLLHAGNKPTALSYFNMFVMLSVQKHLSLYSALHFSARSFQELAACRIILKRIYFILQQSCILELSWTSPAFSWYHTVIVILFLSSRRCLVCLQGSRNYCTVWSLGAPGTSEQSPRSCARFLFAGDWSKIILLAFYFYVPVLLLLLFLNNNCSGFTI